MKNLLKFVLIFSFCFFYMQSYSQQLEKLWETDSVFKVPESVLFDAKNKCLYISNVDGPLSWEKDGNGSIGKMSIDGKGIIVEWVKGFDAPKGMGLYKNKLYVADLTGIVVVDIKKAVIEKKIPIEGAIGLNDISIDPNGIIYISDSKAKKIYKVENEKAELLLENLSGPNGVLASGNSFFILDAGKLFKVENDKTLTKINDGMEGGTDGVVQVGEKKFIVSCWAGVIWYLNADGTKKLLWDSRNEKKNTADIDYNPKTKTVYVPTFWRNSVMAFKVINR